MKKCLVALSVVSALFASAPALSAIADPERCVGLVEAAEKKRQHEKAKAVAEASAIQGGGEDLGTMSCMDNLMGVNFNFFQGIPSISSLVSSLASQVQDEISNTVCDYSDDLQSQVNSFLTCTASVDVDVSAGLPNPNSPELQNCLGAGNAFDFNYSGQVGSSSSDVRTVSSGATVSTGAQVQSTSSKGTSGSFNTLEQGIRDNWKAVLGVE
ncbi:hypothetical protein [Marinobacterium jannaschii]|uniref:hypothetical protein n=1 Tax=Marinobacterium jannaschii TaxID=64970 RepID=UPI000481D9C0|nr:hypothetical protein [Marinobacterium jannaschii]